MQPILTHALPSPELELPRTLHDDRHQLEVVDVPIVTTSASFRSDIKRNFGESTRSKGDDIVFSRAHFSMAVGVLEQAVEGGLSSWLVDPINYISIKDWGKLVMMVKVGRLVARFHFLKHVKDFVDEIARGKMPLTSAITRPLVYVTGATTKPVVSLHYETGNILAREGKQVLQVVTDPYVRSQYLFEAERENITYAVFDKETKKDFLAQAKELGKQVDPARIVVTGPPVDPRIVRAREGKAAVSHKSRPLRLVVTTGGLGQNKEEIFQVLDSIGPLVKEGKVQVLLYGSTLSDFKNMYREVARKFDIPVGATDDLQAALRILYYPGIVDANQSLISYAFDWADGFITKPSGDMAYDAAAAGCLLLLLEPWGEWEESIGKIFTKLNIACKVQTDDFSQQLEGLLQSGWVETSIANALNIDRLFLNGAKKIVDLQQKIAIQ
ncbi:MAG: hypothetical protein HYU80_01485 [Candidatus Blackburnbacteria bacterium]|nr:hypothetical protein [Candidatus Blackburnbacteria bacterium]